MAKEWLTGGAAVIAANAAALINSAHKAGVALEQARKGILEVGQALTQARQGDMLVNLLNPARIAEHPLATIAQVAAPILAGSAEMRRRPAGYEPWVVRLGWEINFYVTLMTTSLAIPALQAWSLRLSEWAVAGVPMNVSLPEAFVVAHAAFSVWRNLPKRHYPSTEVITGKVNSVESDNDKEWQEWRDGQKVLARKQRFARIFGGDLAGEIAARNQAVRGSDNRSLTGEEIQNLGNLLDRMDNLLGGAGNGGGNDGASPEDPFDGKNPSNPINPVGRIGPWSKPS